MSQIDGFRGDIPLLIGSWGWHMWGIMGSALHRIFVWQWCDHWFAQKRPTATRHRIANNMSLMLASKHAHVIGVISDSIHMLIALHRLTCQRWAFANGIQEDSACIAWPSQARPGQMVAIERTSGQTTAKSCIPPKLSSWQVTSIFLSFWYDHRYAFQKRSVWHSDHGQPFLENVWSKCEVNMKIWWIKGFEVSGWSMGWKFLNLGLECVRCWCGKWL